MEENIKKQKKKSNVSSEKKLKEEVFYDQLSLSISVKKASSSFAPNEFISATTFTRKILSVYGHSKEYAGGSLASLTLMDTQREQPAQQWLDEVLELYNLDMIIKLSKTDQSPMLDGRMLIVGLSILEPALLQQLEEKNAYEKLVSELDFPLKQVLSDKGLTLINKETPKDKPDSLPNQSDNPLEKPQDDLLGRAAFARFLAKRIQTVSREEGAYAIHLYGPWGSGKSTLLNFIKTELTEDKEKSAEKWLAVDFNAWRHRHINPPWWPLLNVFYKATRSKLSIWQRFREDWWRLTTGRLHIVVGLLLLILFSWALFFILNPDFSLFKDPDKLLENLGIIIPIIVTIWGIAQSFSRSLLGGSSESVQGYLKSSKNPMNTLKTRFNKLVKHLKPYRVAILIDDLDRCPTQYVVEFLEGIQTLLKEAPVVIVVAADRKWLDICFSEVYTSFTSINDSPAKTLGSLFLEKVFQFTTSVPGIPDKIKEEYWNHLINVKANDINKLMDEKRSKYQKMVKKTATEEEASELIKLNCDKDVIDQFALREQVILHLANPKILERTEHTLKPFGPIIEQNPRAMKRFVNTYAVNRALATLSFVDIEKEQLALWTILSLRWPGLANYLKKNSNDFDNIGKETITGITDEDVVMMLQDKDVKNVVDGGPTQIKLLKTTIEKCSGLHG